MPRAASEALSYLLSSNAVPNTYESASVQLEVDHLASQIAQLRTKLEKLEERFRSYSAVLSPIRRVPAEIWGEILTFVIPDDVLEQKKRLHLVDLQLVCKAWREAARLKHRLWSGLYIDLHQNIPLKEIECWFGRSGNIPKSLEVSIPGHEDCESQDSPCRLHSPALATLLAEGPLGRFSLTCQSSQCFQNLLDALKTVEAKPNHCAWDCLNFMALKFSEEWNESPDPSKSIFFHLPPNITSFELELPARGDEFWFGFDPTTTPLHIPPSFLEQLNSLSLRSDWQGLKWLECILPFCINVQTLKFNFDGMYWEYDADGNYNHVQQRLHSGFLLPKVRTLRLQHIGAYSRSMDILSFIITPQLFDLDISFQENNVADWDWELAEDVLSFVKRSNCEAALRCFRLRHFQADAQQLADTLHGLPLLTHVTLEATAMAKISDAFSRLHFRDVHNLPHLETLELLNLKPHFGCYSLLDVLRWRAPYRWDDNYRPLPGAPPYTLKKLTVTYQTITKEKEWLATHLFIQALRKWSGVSVHIGPVTYVD
ncbi:hypothetical protein H1R20_g9008, partial [Candolleomyces eurysporus]